MQDEYTNFYELFDHINNSSKQELLDVRTKMGNEENLHFNLFTKEQLAEQIIQLIEVTFKNMKDSDELDNYYYKIIEYLNLDISYYKLIEHLDKESKEELINITLSLENDKELDQDKLLAKLQNKSREELRDALAELLDQMSDETKPE